jgi:hypothetical protein
MRRGADDIKWQDVKKRVYKRDDGHCQLFKILTLKESAELAAFALKENQRVLLYSTDPAHIFPVSLFPHLVYEDLNIITLNRFAHDQFENHRSPLTGERLSEEEYNSFFSRMIGEENFTKLKGWANTPELYKKEKEK